MGCAEGKFSFRAITARIADSLFFRHGAASLAWCGGLAGLWTDPHGPLLDDDMHTHISTGWSFWPVSTP